MFQDAKMFIHDITDIVDFCIIVNQAGDFEENLHSCDLLAKRQSSLFILFSFLLARPEPLYPNVKHEQI